MTRHYLRYAVDGFRSLRNADFTLNAGLNVIVGPNGSGKTNIVALIDFVSAFTAQDIYTAFVGAGGSSRVFSNELLAGDTERAKLNIRINGRVPYNYFKRVLSARRPKPIKKTIEFSYNLCLRLREPTFDVLVDLEQLEWIVFEPDGTKSSPRSVALSWSSPDKNFANVPDIEDDFFDIFNKQFSQRLKAISEQNKVTTSDILKQTSDSKSSIFRVPLIGGEDEIAAIRTALRFGRSVNINPDNVREAQDIASTKEPDETGKGTVGKLHELHQAQPNPKRKSIYWNIVRDFKAINDRIRKIDIDPSFETGKFNTFVTVGGGAGAVRIPFTAVSDGTAKWLAILTRLHAYVYSYCLEEPENYLHPAAQKQFMSLLRAVSEDNDAAIYVITTHSETVINATKPEELLISAYGRTGTVIRRLEDPDKLYKAINKTGFGLGFLYAHDRV